VPGGRVVAVDLWCRCCGATIAEVGTQYTSAFVDSHIDVRVTGCLVVLDDTGGTERWELIR
jgi:hypothetical protein